MLTIHFFDCVCIFIIKHTMRKNDNKDAVINMRITASKKKQLARIVKQLKTTRTALLESQINNLIDLYQ